MAVKKKGKKATRASARARTTARAKAARARPTRKPSGLGLTVVSPSFTVNDVSASVAWYTNVLGFELKEEWKRDGKLLGAGLAAGKSFFMIGQDDWKKGHDRIKGLGFRLYCEIDGDVDALAERVRASGWKLDQEPTDHPDWGMRDFTLQDPDGYNLSFAKKIPKRRTGR